MLSSALIGCFTVRLNVELCSDWLFHSASQCWALLWLAVSQCGSVLSSALIGCFTVRLNVELCSDWLFHSAAQCWALLWLAVSQCGSMLSSALIGCFTVRLNVELCSDWLLQCGTMLSSALIGCFTVRLISVAHRKETRGKYIFQYFLAQLYRRVIILYIKCGHQGAAINMLGTETAFKCMIVFHFHFRDSWSHV